MGYETKTLRGREFSVRAPPYRLDILHQIDVIEDLAIGYGYDRLIPELPPIATVGKPSNSRLFESQIRSVLVGLSFQEVLTFTLSNKRLQYDLLNVKDQDRIVEIQNFTSEELSCLRNWLLPHLLNFLSLNKHAKYPQRIFELGYVFEKGGDPETNTSTYRNVSGAISGADITFNDGKSFVDALARAMGWELKLIPSDHPTFIEGRYVNICLQEKNIGLLGEVHPKVLNNFELELPVTAFELTLSGPVPHIERLKTS
jgi:phenylalanyl-tRNA synthetase beta chain